MLMKYKAIACDVDGTILDGNHTIPLELISLVARLQDKGILFTLASARPTRSLLELAGELNLNSPVIALNGGILVDQEHKIFHNPQFLFARLNSLFEDYPNIVINSYNEFDWHASERNSQIIIEEQFVKFDAKVGFDFPAFSNMVVLIAEHSILLQIQERIKHEFPEFNAVFSQAEYLHLAPRHICKASGLAEFARLHQLSLAHFIAFGDGQNDISMLQEVGLGVAMANASEQVKAAAKAVTKFSHHDHGVIKFLYECLEQGIL
jgi:Cof subfamily protein (haloacid dehalogenase superfamily)